MRVSTDAQYEEGYSIDAQVKKLRSWCDSKDYTNCVVYEDGGWSGSNIKRPAMERLLFDIYQGKVKRVLVYKLDRLSRSQKDTLYLLEEVFIPNGVEFYSHNENFDTSTPYGKAMIGVLSVFAQLERENIRDRTRMGMYERVKEGYWPGGGVPPFGYDYDANKNILVPNEHADEVKRIYNLYLEGYSMVQIADMFPVASDKHVNDILERVTYLGKIPYKGEVFQGKHEAIIDEDLWTKVQNAKQRRSQKGISHSQYLLSGMLVCGKCGAKMRYQKWGPGKIKIYCYSQQHSKQYLVKDANCDNSKYDADQIEKHVLSNLFSVTEDVLAVQDSIKEPVDSRLSSVSALLRQQKSVETKLKNLYNKYAENPNDILYETIQDNLAALESIKKSLESEQASADAIQDVSNKTQKLTNLKTLWDGYSVDEKRDLLKLCIKQIVLNDNDIEIQYLI